MCPREACLGWRPRTLSDWQCRKGLGVLSSYFERPLALTFLLRKLRPQNGFGPRSPREERHKREMYLKY